MKDIKNTLYKIGNKQTAFNLWGLFGGDFLQLSKNEIKEIKENLSKATKQEQEILIKKINNWCEVYRCPSLYIK